MDDIEFRTRVRQLPDLANTMGPAFTFGKHALKALKRSRGPTFVDWDQVHKLTILESIEQHGQEADEVHAALSKYSPGAISSEKQVALRGILDSIGPELSRMYDQARTRQDAEYAREQAMNGGQIKFLRR